MFDRSWVATRRVPPRISTVILMVLFTAPCRDGFSAATADDGTTVRQDWPQFNFDTQHSGTNPRETQLTADNVADLKLLFQIKLPAVADGAPVYLSRVTTGQGVRDLLFLTTKPGHIVAIDALTGAQICQRQHPAGPCRINNGRQPCYTTSSPALDPGSRPAQRQAALAQLPDRRYPLGEPDRRQRDGVHYGPRRAPNGVSGGFSPSIGRESSTAPTVGRRLRPRLPCVRGEVGVPWPLAFPEGQVSSNKDRLR